MSNVFNLTTLTEDLVQSAVREAIDAEVVEYRVQRRDTWDGRGFDVQADFLVLWRRNVCRGVEGQESWGTHRGCVRQVSGKARHAHIFEGQYDLDESQARDKYVSRQWVLG